MKKIGLSILGVLIMIITSSLYYVDRIICAILPWFEVISLYEWRPRPFDMKSIKKEFPELDEESYIQISETRKKMRFENIKNSIIRILAIISVWYIVKLIIWLV